MSLGEVDVPYPTDDVGIPVALRSRILPLVERDLELYDLAVAGPTGLGDG